MSYVVVCMVGLLVYTGPGKKNHLNVQLQGIEVRELSSDKSLVDFSADIKAKKLRVVGNTVRKMNMNLCHYRPSDALKFNAAPISGE